jgi:hypothetical protein
LLFFREATSANDLKVWQKPNGTIAIALGPRAKF